MRLVIGLGNPGLRYKSTRHNVGFLVIDKLSKINSVRLRRRKYGSLVGVGRIGSEEVLLMKPLAFMNLSGGPISEVVAKEGLSLERMMVICDDVNLDLGVIRIRPKGSSGGHKGLESIIENLESQEFPRLRIGIGRKDQRDDLSSHVLGLFRKRDREIVNEAVEKAIQALDCWVDCGIQAAMSRYNS